MMPTFSIIFPLKKKPIYKPHAKFTFEEDQKLFSLVNQYGDKCWRFLSKFMPGRNTRQCRERWIYYLNPELCHDQWTKEEDDLIIEKHRLMGPKWMEIAKFFNHRTDAMIKNRFNYIKRKKMRQENFEAFDESKNNKSAIPSFDNPSGTSTKMIFEDDAEFDDCMLPMFEKTVDFPFDFEDESAFSDENIVSFHF